MSPWGLRSTFHAAAGLSVNIPCGRGPSVNFSCIHGTLRASGTFCASSGLYINFSCVFGTVCKLPSTFVHSRDPPLTFHGTVGPSVTFSQISVRCIHQLFVNFSCGQVHSVNFLCVHTTFRHFVSTQSFVIFRASTGPSVNFCQLSLTLRDRPSTSVKFPWVHGNFCQHSVLAQDLRETSVNFCASLGPSVNFPCYRRAFHLLSVWQRDFHQVSTTFRTSVGSFVNFR